MYQSPIERPVYAGRPQTRTVSASGSASKRSLGDVAEVLAVRLERQRPVAAHLERVQPVGGERRHDRAASVPRKSRKTRPGTEAGVTLAGATKSSPAPPAESLSGSGPA